MLTAVQLCPDLIKAHFSLRWKPPGGVFRVHLAQQPAVQNVQSLVSQALQILGELVTRRQSEFAIHHNSSKDTYRFKEFVAYRM